MAPSEKSPFSRLIMAGIIGVMVSSMLGCGKNQNTPLGPSSGLILVTVSPKTITLPKTGTQTFTASGGTGSFTWSISNTSLGNIDPITGAFTAGSTPGSLIVTATDNKGNTGTATVIIIAQTIAVTPQSVTIAKKGTQTFSGTGGTGTFIWSVSDPSLGSIDAASGLFTAGSTTGTVTVTATDTAGNTGTASVTIVSASIVVVPSVLTISKQGTQTFTATGGSGVYFWSSSNPTIGQINTATGVFTADSIAGNITITATDTNGDTGTATVIVVSATIIVSPANLTILNTETTLSRQYTASGGSGSFSFSISGETNGYTGAAMTTSGLLTFSIPTKTEGDQTLTVTATDLTFGDKGTTTITLLASTL